MSVSYENSKVIFQGIKDAGITSLSALPETWLGLLLQQAERDPDVKLIQVAKEEEAIGVAAGLPSAAIGASRIPGTHAAGSSPKAFCGR